MTLSEAVHVLGADSMSHAKAGLLYREKREKLRLQMVPGMPVGMRQNAQAELARLEAAWQIINAQPATPKKRRTRRNVPRRPAKVVPRGKPQTLGEAWDQVASAMPFPEPVLVVMVILVALLILVALVRYL
jgi:hypothetical protein